MLLTHEVVYSCFFCRVAASSNNRVNQTAGSSVALIAVKFSGRRWLPLAFFGDKDIYQ